MVYGTVVRQRPDGVFGVFDCPDGGQIAPKRTRSTTPLQALNLFTQSAPEAEEKKRKAALKRLLKGMKASNTQPMTPLKREEIYDR